MLKIVARTETEENNLCRRENWLFFKRWLRHPMQLGTLAPITRRLATHVAQHINGTAVLSRQHIVEIGSGTGRLTRALLQTGANQKALHTVELDPEFFGFLNDTLPHVNHSKGDARCLAQLLPGSLVGQVDLIVSVLPLAYFQITDRLAFLESSFEILSSGGKMYHVTYSPLPLFKDNTTIGHKKLCAERVSTLWPNVPPGFLWRFWLEDTLVENKNASHETRRTGSLS